MKKRAAILLLTMFVFLSCKNDTAKEESTPADTGVENFRVTLKIVSKKQDNICLLYTQDGTINFKDEVVWQSVEGSENEQDVVFDLPKDTYPTQMRIDFGIKSESDEVVLKSVKIEHKTKSKIIAGTELGLVFRADDSKCTFDAATGLIKSNETNLHPSLYPQEANLKPILEGLFK
jgi:hypothetical protein